MHYLKAIETFQATTEQEAKDQALMLEFMKRHPDVLTRANLAGHLTSSVFIMNVKKTKVLFGFHNIYQSWGWFGGHHDGMEDCLEVALKEAREETGIAVYESIPSAPISLDVITVNNHYKNGEFIPDHLHLNVTYGLLTSEKQVLTYNDQEHSGIKWFLIEEYLDHVKEERMKPIYQKIVQRMLASDES
jgi:8-oxo-dGTP pyrophosphatase MutT (NUDIX family)